MFNNSSYEDNYTVEFRCGIPPVIPGFLNIPYSVSVIQGVIAILCGLVGLPMNVYLFVIIIKFKSLHQRSLLLQLQVIVVEILYYVVFPPLILVAALKERWIFGEAMCNITGMLHDAFPSLRFYFTLALTIDRFFLTFWPFFYAKHGRSVAGCLWSIMWVSSIVGITIPVYGILDCYTYVPIIKSCTFSLGCSSQCQSFGTAYVVFYTIVAKVAPFIFLFAIIFKVRSVKRQHDVVSLENFQNVQKNAQLLYMQMHKNKKTLLILLLVVAIGGTTPGFLFYVLSLAIKKPNAFVFIGNMLVGQTLFNLIPVFDSFVLTLHKDIRKVSSEIFKSLLKVN